MRNANASALVRAAATVPVPTCIARSPPENRAAAHVTAIPTVRPPTRIIQPPYIKRSTRAVPSTHSSIMHESSAIVIKLLAYVPVGSDPAYTTSHNPLAHTDTARNRASATGRKRAAYSAAGASFGRGATHAASPHAGDRPPATLVERAMAPNTDEAKGANMGKNPLNGTMS